VSPGFFVKAGALSWSSRSSAAFCFPVRCRAWAATGDATERRELAAVGANGALRFDPKVSYFVQACRSDCAYIGDG